MPTLLISSIIRAGPFALALSPRIKQEFGVEARPRRISTRLGIDLEFMKADHPGDTKMKVHINDKELVAKWNCNRENKPGGEFHGTNCCDWSQPG